jgi:alginate O-acetyltransferase complex protein AlgJ
MSLERRSQQAIALAFSISLAIPLLGHLLGIENQPYPEEWRRPHQKPPLSLKLYDIFEFFQEYPPYFSDRFGFRNRFLRWQSQVKAQGFGVSSGHQVQVGKQEWLFLHDRQQAIQYYRNTKPFTLEELALWQAIFEKRQRAFAQRGIQYLLIVTPEKSTIYPEFVRDRYNKIHPFSRLDQLLAYLKKHSEIQALDLRPILRQAKSQAPVYYRTGEELTDWGAYQVYRAIVQHFQDNGYSQLKARSLSDFKAVPEDYSGNLARAIHLNTVFREATVRFYPKNPQWQQKIPPDLAKLYYTPNPDQKPSATLLPNLTLPRAVLFHNGVGKQLQPFLSHHFQRLTPIWQSFVNLDMVAVERPNWVLQEMPERYLSSVDPRQFRTTDCRQCDRDPASDPVPQRE